jgi:hypothetical protein
MEVQGFLERKEKKLLPLITAYETIIQNHIQFNEKNNSRSVC